MPDKFFDKIHFNTREDLEFILCLLELSHWEDTRKAIESGALMVDKDSAGMLSAMYDKIPDEMHREMKYFFSDMDIAWGIVGYEFLQAGIKSIPDMLANLKEQDEAILISNIVETFMFSNLADEQICKGIKDIRDDIGAMLSAVKKVKIQKKNLKQKVIKILENSAVYKKRIWLLFSDFYEKIYRSEEDKIAAYLTEVREKYQLLYNNDPGYFFDRYMKHDRIDTNQGFQIHISYFVFYCCLFLSSWDWNQTCMILGSCNDINLVPEGSADKNTLHKLFKILGDKTRFDIICALNNRPYYNQELAEKFGLSPSTVNYHLAAMMEVGIVSGGREDHRVYYILKKDVLDDLLGKSTKIMI